VALSPVLATWLHEMGLPETLRTEAVMVSARRDQPAHARRLLDYFEALGSTTSW